MLIHGAGGGSWQWQRWQNGLSARRIASLAVDLQPTSGGLANTDLGDYLAQLQELQARQSCSVIVGASMGAVLAWQLSATLPLRHVLIMINPPSALSSVDQKQPRVIRWRGNKPLSSTRKHMSGASSHDCYFAHCHWRDESGTALAQARSWQPCPGSAPTLLVLGAEDAAAGNDQGQEMAKALSADRMTIEAAGHLQPLLSSAAETTLARVEPWVRSQAISIP